MDHHYNLNIKYVEKFFSTKVADSFFKKLEKSVEYFHPDVSAVVVRHKKYQIPRKVSAYGDISLTYCFSGTRLPTKPMISVVKQLLDLANDFIKKEKNQSDIDTADDKNENDFLKEQNQNDSDIIDDNKNDSNDKDIDQNKNDILKKEQTQYDDDNADDSDKNSDDNDVDKNENENLNYVFINRYENGLDYLGFHKDDEKDMDSNFPIVTFSFGIKRDIIFKRKKYKNVKIPLEHGSMLVMYPPTNQFWYHGIPKRKKVKDVRISLTFRRNLSNKNKE
ncbi:DNA oxidative demethylase ALKBH2 [Araneus ventricosus]|uniref:DNA oxidative demethylase ALKBH2 n=1 Tax=Araneus ventricosus TaxID=182803 RepID=A0A4Y2U5W6_ARAVE|nr:DNA oxidative demethylase ALKBH2 [Araneus ventricosus]